MLSWMTSKTSTATTAVRTRFNTNPYFASLHQPINEIFMKDDALRAESKKADTPEITKEKVKVYSKIRAVIQLLIDEYNKEENLDNHKSSVLFLQHLKQHVAEYHKLNKDTLYHVRHRLKYAAQMTATMAPLCLLASSNPAVLACGVAGFALGCRSTVKLEHYPESARLLLNLIKTCEQILVDLKVPSDLQSELNPYDVLGVEERATTSEIAAAYKKLLSQYHPDKLRNIAVYDDKTDQSRAICEKITEAYTQLTDVNTRAACDENLRKKRETLELKAAENFKKNGPR